MCGREGAPSSESKPGGKSRRDEDLGRLCRLPPWREPRPRPEPLPRPCRGTPHSSLGWRLCLALTHALAGTSALPHRCPSLRSSPRPACALRLGGGGPTLGGRSAAAWQLVYELAMAQRILSEARGSLREVDKMADQGTPTGRGPRPCHRQCPAHRDLAMNLPWGLSLSCPTYRPSS